MTICRRRWLAAAVVGVSVLLYALGGCDEGSSSTSPPTAPQPPMTTAPADLSPALPTTTPASTAPAATQPTSSLMNINGHVTVFPPARLRLESDGQHVIALLYTDDPKDALKDNYTGNSFYLRMVLDIEDAEKLNEASWQYQAPSSGDREDTPYGVFLGGRKIALQPFKVAGRFKVNADGTTAYISGQFQMLDDTPGRGPAQVLPISAELPVKIDAETGPSK
jgi:hypothetical protein